MSTNQSPAPRRYRMTVESVDPMSVLRLSFLLSVALGIAFIVATAILWTVLNSMHVWAGIENVAKEFGSPRIDVLLEYLHFGKAMALSSVIAVINVLLMTVASTIGALIYNVVVKLVGGVTVQLIDE
ncbi:hypothetical protein BSR29_00180 [Boudabousia liubingyangii]|uniref:DUF3566 domain-containing protein n=1 Tax=Boudabousia liubingyangii TaxID=1921764 RepID=A0A1Q5PPG6_9ACTO|nr:DUF3566 domain-containing protein [Boudabousia liubingyangii]OKL48537.1 hypothetical protein BSR28_02300 [Boudabousia liubingyangii]OKL49427.1 hypothetical protein BSR29_00180 [Boudabousia liubingyangii]